MVFGSIIDKIKGKESEKSTVPSYVLIFMPQWFKDLSPTQQSLLWELAKKYQGSSASSSSSSGGILGGVLGRGRCLDVPECEDIDQVRSMPEIQSIPDTDSGDAQNSWAELVAAARILEGNANPNEWPFTDPEFGGQCCSLMQRLPGMSASA
eukprot:Protomagalhaensia_wolfi_Nauph_80__3419@NODE_3471_length_789_cov_697_640000_g2580_i1_p1_GENE_NODE_3471_length_789_cov_697_640000_g2580_i1NODE_3471_length_789_cov_697_640000_g2580_i1_p1_ORF_typecomplete_len152_score38_54PI_PP_I/PF18363_1/0_026_NODE_3471_length_789_cov_697_640000_g2580_i1122577